ncbi:winged helix-turn-helix domain-containing protein [Christiangramia flava]|uniref:DNA-binding domain of ModE n=1 Tax=Christiangramia flava JLT2011 TaxID=1229726 RepID=A0A1L7I2E9_9FLAO|nr:LysR family transcriptional regulator [Christiangramia flava]APU67770.1 DNA-binding domain of ModE [Christiangramia flava JLT2011]OSS40273.1 N-terminal domain of molybdenum-binding protein [Christiangramia flava JLT2011]
MKKINFKCWIEQEGEKFYGPGPHELLKWIQSEGSLSRAAAEMGMSYKKAWEMVQRLNQFSGEPMVIAKKGGSHGGGAVVTSQAEILMQEYEQLKYRLAETLEKERTHLRFLN